MENSTFITDLKNTISDRLNDYEGTNIYMSELSYTLFQCENTSGSVLCNTYKTKEFIKANFDLFGDLVTHVKDNMDMLLNPFAEPEKAHVILMLEASSQILSKLKTVDKNWNEELELTPKLIEKLKKELDSLELDEEYLF